MAEKLKIGLLLDMHPFDEIALKRMFDKMEGVEVFPQLIANYLFDYAGNNNKYDGFVFYNMTMATPDPEETFAGGHKKVGETLCQIGESGQGIVVLHHAILSYPEWDLFNELLSLPDRKFDYFGNVNVEVYVEDSTHPITAGLSDWTMIDETFLLPACTDDATVILSTDCDKSISSLAWAKEYKKSRVFAMSLGHDAQAFDNPNFAKVLENAILWSCTRK